MRREYGVDLARIVAIFMVFLIHNLWNGGVLEETYKSRAFFSMWYIENLGIVAVNMFAMITGYLMATRKINYERLFNVVVQTMFWSIFIVFACIPFVEKITLGNILENVLSIFSVRYWYVNAYIGMLLMAPFLNKGMQHLSELYLTKLIVGFLIVACTLGYVDGWFLLSGYSSFWLAIMYMVGGYLKIYKPLQKIQTKYLMTLFFVMPVAYLVGEFYVSEMGYGPLRIISYNSPWVFVQSVALFESIRRFKVPDSKGRFVAGLGSLTFGAYIINGSYLYDLLKNQLEWVKSYNPVQQLLWVLGITTIMFLGALVMEFTRMQLFKRCGIDKLIHSVFVGIENRFHKLVILFVRQRDAEL